jgi:dnd system-associated protein 4
MSDSTIRQYYHRHELYDKMVDDWDLFNTYVDFFVFAASVGYATVDRTTAAAYDESEFTGDGEMLWMHLSNKQTYRAVAASIAYQHTGDPEALVSPKIQLEVLARYAKAGVERLAREFGDSATTPRDGLLSFIENEQPSGEAEDEDLLGAIVDSFDQNMIRE